MATNKLYINDSGTDVAIAELGIISGKQQAILGDFERDLILRTSGNIQIQVGNKFYPLSFLTSITSGGTATVVNSTTTILNKISDLSTLAYSGDGNYVYIRENGAFYITVDSGYVRLNSGSTSTGGSTTQKVYLSFDEEQDLTGAEKYRVVLNTGGVINSISDIANYGQGDVYAGQVVYAINESRHYYLADASNPSLSESWKEIYLNLQDGGVVLGTTVYSIGEDVSSSLSSLHVSSNAAYTTAVGSTVPLQTLSVGTNDLTSGIAIWNNAGNVYLQSLAADGSKGFNFVTGYTTNTFQPLTLAKNSVGIAGPINYDYNLTVTGNTLFKNNNFFINNLSSPDYVTGYFGQGFGLTRDSGNLWTLEVDNLLVRKNITDLSPSFNTLGLDGSQIFNYTITVNVAHLIESIPLYIKAVSSGKYSDTSGTIKPFTSRARNVNVVHSTLATLDNDPSTIAYEKIALSYAIGDTFDDNTVDTTTTYNKDQSGTYYTPVGQYRYDSGTNSFVADSSGDLIQINEIAVYYIESSSNDSIAVGDLLYYKSWNDNKSYQGSIHAEVVSRSTDGGYYLYVYDNMFISQGTQFIKVGNTVTGQAFMQTNASDTYSPFTELLSGVNSFRALYTNYYYELDTDYPDTTLEDSISNKSNTRVKIGDLSNLYDTDLVLSTQQYGLYADNIYAKGNFVLNRSKFNNVTVVTAPSYQPFLMLGSDGRLQQIDLTTKIAQWDTVTPQLQSDWNQTNTSALDYIKNKPTKLSQFTNDSGYITGFTETDPTVPAYAKTLSAFSVIQTSTDALYPSKTGSGASGTWSINVSGSSTSVTNSLTNGYGISALSYNGSSATTVVVDNTVIAPLANPQFTGVMKMQLENGGLGLASFTNLPSGQNFNIWRNILGVNDEVSFVSVPGVSTGTSGGFSFWTYNPSSGSSGGLVKNLLISGVDGSLATDGHITFGGINAAFSPTAFAWYNPATKEIETMTASQASALVSGGGTGFANPMTTAGDMIFKPTGSGVADRLPIGSSGQVLTVSGGLPVWQTPSSGGGMTNPMTTLGDIITGAASGVPQRLAAGSAGQVLTMVSGSPAWSSVSTGWGLTGAPTITSTGGLGSGGSVSIAGYNEAGIITMTTGTSGITAGAMATIDFGSHLYPTATIVTLTVNASSTNNFPTNTVLTAGAGANTWTLCVTVALPASQSYKINYHVRGY